MGKAASADLLGLHTEARPSLAGVLAFSLIGSCSFEGNYTYYIILLDQFSARPSSMQSKYVITPTEASHKFIH